MAVLRFFRQFRFRQILWRRQIIWRRLLLWRRLPLAIIALVLVAGVLAWKSTADWQSGSPPGVPVVTSNDPLLAVHAMPPLFPALVAVPAAAGSSPHLELSSSFYDFGVLRSATAPVSRDFFIINRGRAPLVIREAVTTCGCTTAQLSAAVAPPGTAIRATVTFDPAFHDIAGQTVRRGLILLTNDPDRPEADIWVQVSLK